MLIAHLLDYFQTRKMVSLMKNNEDWLRFIVWSSDARNT